MDAAGVQQNLKQFITHRDLSKSANRWAWASKVMVAPFVLAVIAWAAIAGGRALKHKFTDKTGEQTHSRKVALQSGVFPNPPPEWGYKLPKSAECVEEGIEKGGLIVSSTGRTVREKGFPEGTEFTENGFHFPKGFDYWRNDHDDGTYTITAYNSTTKATFQATVGTTKVTCKKV